MKTEYSVLRDALLDIVDLVGDGPSAEFLDIDDDDIAEIAISGVAAMKDAFNECVDEVTNDIE